MNRRTVNAEGEIVVTERSPLRTSLTAAVLTLGAVWGLGQVYAHLNAADDNAAREITGLNAALPPINTKLTEHDTRIQKLELASINVADMREDSREMRRMIESLYRRQLGEPPLIGQTPRR